MAVSNYLAKSEYGCRYHYDKLKDVIYLVSESHLKFINIDNGEANISGLTEAPLKITGFNIEFKEETSLDERYKFQKSLTISVNGYSTFEDFDEKYYAIIVAKDNTYYMVNVDFPSKVTHTYHLSKDTNRTDFTLSSVSNFPALKLNGFNPDNATSCKNYAISGVDGLKMLESAKTELKESENKVVATEEFKLIEYLGETLSFQEVYDGDKFTTTLEFQIAFDAYKTSWHYNLLEFIMNRYAAIIGIKNSSNKIYTGFKEGLQPNYSIESSNGKDKSDIVTITLIETANKGLTVGDFVIEINTNKHWRYVSKVGNINAFSCLGDGMSVYILQEECNYFGKPTGRYKVLNGYESLFPALNIIGTFTDEVTFYNPNCNKAPIYDWRFFNNYYCIGGNKYQALQMGKSYDEGRTWIKTDSEEAILGDFIESSSQWCENNPPIYSWKLTDLYECSYSSGNQLLYSSNYRLDTVDLSNFVPSATSITWKPNDGALEFDTPLTEIKSRAFYRCSGLTSVNIPNRSNSIKIIGDEAFYFCDLLSNIIIPNSVTSIGYAAFAHTTIIYLNIPDSVISIGNRAFENCGQLLEVTIGAGITSIGDYAFAYCYRLGSVTIYAITPPSLGSNAFRKAYGEIDNIYVPEESVNAYKSASGWSNYANKIKPIT